MDRRGGTSNPRRGAGVRVRKLTISEGEGTVHGNSCDLELHGIRLRHARGLLVGIYAEGEEESGTAFASLGSPGGLLQMIRL